MAKKDDWINNRCGANTRWWLLIPVLALLVCHNLLADDVVELTNGTQVRGRLISQDDRYVQIEIQVNGRTLTRKYPRRLVSKVVRNAGENAAGNTPVRSAQEVKRLIQTKGSTPPDWLEETKLNIPSSLDLTWPHPVKGGWNSSRNVGQFIWDRVNPNPSQWKNGVKLMHHIMELDSSGADVDQRAMLALGHMYHNLIEDHARAAYWWQKAGVDRGQGAPMAMLLLADSYFRLGSKQMATDLLKNARRVPPGVIKLLGDMGETEQALKQAESVARNGNEVVAYLYAGDVCRVAGRLSEAESYYRKTIVASEKDNRNENYARRDKSRAQASLAAIKFFKLSPKNVEDGTYSASSQGYEDQVEVRVVVQDGRMTDIQVTRHREKQFYSSIKDTPRNLLAKQAFIGVDTTSGATITSEAIINATAKALSQGSR